MARIWDTTHRDNSFFVTKGVQYQIGFGTYGQADTQLILRMASGVAPSGLRAIPGSEGYPGAVRSSTTLRVGESLFFNAVAQGTAPLIYQWHKDGLAISGATNSNLNVSFDVDFEHAGTYSVVVSNGAGTLVSDPIPITVVAERSHLPDIMRGSWSWTLSTWNDRQIVTFTDDQFTLRSPSDGTVTGRGHYRLIGTWSAHSYHLTMTHTELTPGVTEEYQISILDRRGSYESRNPDGTIRSSGSIWRLEEP